MRLARGALLAALAALPVQPAVADGGAALGCEAALAELHPAGRSTIGLSEAGSRAIAAMERQGRAVPVVSLKRLLDQLKESGDDAPLATASLALRFSSALERHCAFAAAPEAARLAPEDRSRLGEILERAEFAHAKADTDFADRILASLWQSIVDLMGNAQAERYASGGRAVFFAAVGTITALALAFAVRRRLRARRQLRPSGELATIARVETANDPTDALRAADRALLAGDGGAAIREAFAAIVTALERAAQVDEARTRTNAEILADLAHPHGGALAQAFLPLARAQERVAYGLEPATLDRARAYLEEARALAAEVSLHRG
jgi:hypothetical protein